MNFALLGSDPACLPLVRAISRAPQHALAAVAHPGELWSDLTRLVPTARQVTDWQQLLVEPNLDAVIVAGYAPEVLTGARAVAREGRSLIVIPDVRQTSAFAYELWPNEDEERAVLVPVWQLIAEGAVAKLREDLDSVGIGRLRFVQLERTLPPGDDGRRPLTDFENALLCDAELLRQLGGDYARVTSVAVGLKDDRVAMLTVTLTGDGLPEATWRMSVAGGSPTTRLMLTGKQGTLIPPQRERVIDDQNPADWDGKLEAVERRLTRTSNQPGWTSVVRAFDVVDAARRSVRRRRTVEIGSEAISEQRQFKSLMTAAGCGVLLYTMFGVVAALLIGVSADPRDAAQKRAAAADFILRDQDFAGASADLSVDGQAHVGDIASRLWTTTAEIIVEDSPGADSAALAQQRMSAVESALQEAGAADVAGRIVTRPLAGLWFERLMIGVWVIVFAPLALLLAIQLLGFAARPDQ